MRNLQKEINNIKKELEYSENLVKRNIREVKSLNSNFDFDKKYFKSKLTQEDIYNLTSYWLYVYREDLSVNQFGSSVFDNLRGELNDITRKRINYEEGFSIIKASVINKGGHDIERNSIFIADVDKSKLINRFVDMLIDSESNDIIRGLWFSHLSSSKRSTISIEKFSKMIRRNFFNKEGNIHRKFNELFNENFIRFRKMDLTELNHGKSLELYAFELQFERYQRLQSQIQED